MGQHQYSTVFLCFQICLLAPKQFTKQPADTLSAEKIADVEAAIRYCLGL